MDIMETARALAAFLDIPYTKSMTYRSANGEAMRDECQPFTKDTFRVLSNAVLSEDRQH